MEESLEKSHIHVEIPISPRLLHLQTEGHDQEIEDLINSHSKNLVEFNTYIDKFDQTVNKVNINQLEQLQRKYRFYLSKVQKLQECKDLLQAKFDSLDELVENSGAVMEQKDSIKFILMISEETKKKLDIFSEKVNTAKEEKKVYHKQIAEIYNEIKKEKDRFFELKRSQLSLVNEMEEENKVNKLETANQTFRNIVCNKIQKNREKIGIKSENYESKKQVEETSKNITSNFKYQPNFTETKSNEFNLPEIPQVHTKGNVENKKEGKSIHSNESFENPRPNFKEMSSSAAFHQYKKTYNSKSKAKDLRDLKLMTSVNFITNKKNNKNKNFLMKNGVKQIQKENKFEEENFSSTFYTNKNQKGKKIVLKAHKTVDCREDPLRYSMQNFSIKMLTENEDKVDFIKMVDGESLEKIEEYETEREKFMQMSPDEIIKKLIRKGKIGELMELMERENAYSFSKHDTCQLIR